MQGAICIAEVSDKILLVSSMRYDTALLIEIFVD